jgi:hypothetical protein
MKFLVRSFTCLLLGTFVLLPFSLIAATVTDTTNFSISATVPDPYQTVTYGGTIYIPPIIDVLPSIPPIIIDPLPRLCKIADLNCDGYVDLIDFSILIYWFNREDAPAHVDLAKDNVINIQDFSIMAFYWTG